MADYKTVGAPSHDTIYEKKSEFIGYISHAKTEADAQSFLASIRKKHYDARHACYAYIIKDEKIERQSDDGEPQKTAGMPILEVLRHSGLEDVIIVVVRYFGGVKLGTSGLIVAYRAAAAEALEAVPHIEKTINGEIILKFSYPLLNDVLRIVKEEEPKVVEQVFDNDCMVRLSMRLSRLPRLVERYEKLVIASRNDLKIE